MKIESGWKGIKRTVYGFRPGLRGLRHLDVVPNSPVLFVMREEIFRDYQQAERNHLLCDDRYFLRLGYWQHFPS